METVLVGLVAAVFVAVIVAGLFLLMALAWIWEGYVLSILWGWYAVPLFKLPELSVAAAVGIAVTVGMVTSQYVPKKDKDQMVYAYIFLKPAMALLIGWIALRYV